MQDGHRVLCESDVIALTEVLIKNPCRLSPPKMLTVAHIELRPWSLNLILPIDFSARY